MTTNSNEPIRTDPPTRVEHVPPPAASQPQPTRLIDQKTFAIGILSVTACILFVGLLLSLSTPTPAYGIGQTDRGGDYIMVTQQLTNSQEGVVIIDAAAKLMTMYALDGSNRQLKVLQQNIPLDQLPVPKPPLGP